MGALPNSQPIVDVPPSTKRKPAAKAPSLVREIRSRDEISERFTAGSAYKDFSGWAQVPRLFACDAFSLASGAAWWALVMYLVESMGRKRENGMPLSEVEIDKAEVSLLIRTSIHNINLVLSQMAERQLAIVSHLAGGKAIVRFVYLPEVICGKQFPGWHEVSKVPHEQWARLKAESLRDEADEVDETADDLEEQRVKKGIVSLTRKPRTLKPGKKDAAIPVNTGVKAFRMDLVESDDLDVSYTAAVHSGEFVATVCVPKQKSPRSNQDAKPTVSTTSENSSGRARPNGQKIPPNEGSENHPQSGVDFTVGKMRTAEAVASHARAGELAALFDPILYSYTRKTLSALPAELKKACEAIEDTPHDFLVDALNERAERKIQTNHVVSLLLEIRHNFLKSKDMPIKAKLPTRDEIFAMAAREREERLAKRRKS